MFGFSISQCALQLPTLRGHVDISHPVALLLYFGTFALIGSLWLTYHRMLSGAFKPTGIDLFIPFAYLALVSLMPYAMYEITHNSDASSSQSALFYYLVIYATMTALSTVLTFRNMRRGFFHADRAERDFAWNTVLRQGVLCGMMCVALVVNAFGGPTRAGLFLLFIFVAIKLARKRFPRSPSAAKLRVKAPAG